jgi:hypothetical protein
MIAYHGTPIGGPRQDVARFFMGRHALVPFFRPEDMPVVGEVCASFVLDNSAFSLWGKGETLDRDRYYRWVEEWHLHPGFDWAIIPDVIDGTEEDNDALLEDWPDFRGVPVWHLHESIERLVRLTNGARQRLYPCVALGSSGQWPTPGKGEWWDRIGEAMAACASTRTAPPWRGR